MSTNTAWLQMSDLPFDKDCAKPPLLIGDNILLSPNYNKHLYLFNTKTQSFTKHNIGYSDLEGHVSCLSMDKKQLYIYEGFEKILLIIDVKTMKLVKEIKNLLDTGSYPVIIADHEQSDSIHIIGGQCNWRHVAINVDAEKMHTIHNFSDLSQMYGALVPMKYTNRWLYFGQNLPVHEYNSTTKVWRNTNIKMEPALQGFGYILSHNEKYIIILGGYSDNVNRDWGNYTFIANNLVILFDVDAMEFIVTKIKCPKTEREYRFDAVLTNTGHIHLFNYPLQRHWQIHINQILKPSNVLIYGYIKQCNIHIPVDITNEIAKFFGCIYF